MKIGMAGTGRMGAAIAQRLAGRGHQVTVWNRTRTGRAPSASMLPTVPPGWQTFLKP